MRDSKHWPARVRWGRRVLVAATLAVGSALALAGPASAGWIWH